MTGSDKPKNLQPKQDKEANLPVVDVAGRFVSQFDEKVALEILEELAEGKTLNAICRGVPGRPHPTTFRRWMVNNPTLARAYQTAILVSATSMEEEALETARAVAEKPVDGTNVRAQEVKIKQLQWSAERRDPSKFGVKSQISVKVPVQIITPLDMNLGSTPNPQDIYTLEAKTTKTIEAEADKDANTEPLVPEAPAIHRRKVVLMPPSGVKDETPFSLAMRGVSRERNIIRKEGAAASISRQPRARNAGVHHAGTEGDHSHSQGDQRREEAPESDQGKVT